MKVSLVEQMVFRFPEGFEGWRAYRIEYSHSTREDMVWLPDGIDVHNVEEAMNDPRRGNPEAN